MNELDNEIDRLKLVMKESLITGRLITKQLKAAQQWHKLNQQLNSISHLIVKKSPEFRGISLDGDMIALPDNHPLKYAKECYPRHLELLGLMDDLEIKYNNYKKKLTRLERQKDKLNNNNNDNNTVLNN